MMSEYRGLRVPPDVAARAVPGGPLGIQCDLDGRVTCWPNPGMPYVFPPVGFLVWEFRNLGDGDAMGYYWPVGREDRPPIVCECDPMTHEVFPFATDLPGSL